MITVADAGPGINNEDLEHIFEPFYQATGASRTGHAGLGLAIAQRMVSLQQGKLSVRNADGAVFTVWLPWPPKNPQRYEFVTPDERFRESATLRFRNGIT